MAEETQAQAQETQGEQPMEETTDWKAKYEVMREHMRDWEKKAKENQSAADELEKLRAEQMTEQEKANKRAEQAEAELKKLKAEAEHVKLVKAVSEKTGVPESIVASLSAMDEEELTAQAQAIAENYTIPGGAPKAPEAGKFPKDGGGSKTTAEQFADSVKDLFKH